MVRREERSAVCALDPILESLVGAVTVKFCCAALVSRHVAAAHNAATPTRMVPRRPLRQLVPSVIILRCGYLVANRRCHRRGRDDHQYLVSVTGRLTARLARG